MRIRLSIFLLIVIPVLAFGQKKMVEYTGKYTLPSYLPEDVARGIFLERAKSEAIATEFGTSLRSESMVSSFNDQSSAHGESFFHEINTMIVPGVWLGDEQGYPKFQRLLQNGQFVISVSVKGWVVQHNNTATPIEVKVLRNGTDPRRFESQRFIDGDRMNVWMKSPVSGYVCVYLYDHQAERAYCLLPYSSAEDGAYSIRANQDYVFFAPEMERNKNIKVDRFMLTAENHVDYNVLYILFSPNKFAQPNSKYGENQINARLITPASMDYADFMKWKADMLTADSRMEERSIMLEIKKK